MTRNIKNEPSVASQWEDSRRLLNEVGAHDSDESVCRYLFDLEDGVLRGPIRSVKDAIAKLRAVELSFIEGERSDGADAIALRETIRWLETNFQAATGVKG